MLPTSWKLSSQLAATTDRYASRQTIYKDWKRGKIVCMWNIRTLSSIHVFFPSNSFVILP